MPHPTTRTTTVRNLDQDTITEAVLAKVRGEARTTSDYSENGSSNMSEPIIAARVKPFARREQDDRPKRDVFGDSSVLLLLPFGQREVGRVAPRAPLKAARHRPAVIEIDFAR